MDKTSTETRTSRGLSPAKQSLIRKRLAAAFTREGCSWHREPTRRKSGSLFVPLQPHGSRPPIVFVHGAGGGLLWGYKNLAVRLDRNQPVYAIEPRSIGDWRELRTVEQMASAYLDELRAFQPTGPYYLSGYCFGGLIAYELARQLWLRCERIGALIIVDAPVPNGSYSRLPWWRPSFMLNFSRNCLYWLQDFRHLDSAAKHNFVRRKLGVAIRKSLRRFRGHAAPPDQLDLEQFIDPQQFPDDELELWKLHLQAEADYVPKPYPGNIILLRTRGQPVFCSLDNQLGWGDLAAGGVTVRIVPGAHEKIFDPPYVSELSEAFQSCLAPTIQRFNDVAVPRLTVSTV